MTFPLLKTEPNALSEPPVPSRKPTSISTVKLSAQAWALRKSSLGSSSRSNQVPRLHEVPYTILENVSKDFKRIFPRLLLVFWHLATSNALGFCWDQWNLFMLMEEGSKDRNPRENTWKDHRTNRGKGTGSPKESISRLKAKCSLHCPVIHFSSDTHKASPK